MKQFLIDHKWVLLGGVAGCLAVACILALYFTHRINGGKEEFPPGRVHDAGVFGDDITVYDSSNGPVVINLAGSGEEDEDNEADRAPMQLVANPDDIWTEDTYAGNHTPVSKVVMEDGSIGVLTIDKLGLSVNVFDSTDDSMIADMSKGIAHFPSTSSWDGTVGLSAHNINYDGSPGFFMYLHTLSEGDSLHYKTTLGERTYAVSSITTIDASDWTPLYHQDYNNLTLITCISGQPSKRLCVKAVEQ